MAKKSKKMEPQWVYSEFWSSCGTIDFDEMREAMAAAEAEEKLGNWRNFAIVPESVGFSIMGEMLETEEDMRHRLSEEDEDRAERRQEYLRLKKEFGP